MSDKQDIVAYRSFRLSLRWLPGGASEPTSTIVLTGARTGIFLDTRFFKGTKRLDWGIAGYRTTDPDAPNVITFKHLIDSRTLDEVEDKGTNSTLPDGTTLEVGKMVNPETERLTPFEEIWRDEEETDGASVLFIKNMSGLVWKARVGNLQMALGRTDAGTFWAWQAEKEVNGGWVVKYSTPSVVDTKISFLPEHQETCGWDEGSTVDWEGDDWVVLERGQP